METNMAVSVRGLEGGGVSGQVGAVSVEQETGAFLNQTNGGERRNNRQRKKEMSIKLLNRVERVTFSPWGRSLPVDGLV
jgi:hypothetical protein